MGDKAFYGDGSPYVYPDDGGLSNGTAQAWTGRDGRCHATAGENGRTSKLTEVKVREILMLPRRGEPGYRTHAEIAADYGVSKGQIKAIRQGTAWAHVKVERPTATSSADR